MKHPLLADTLSQLVTIDVLHGSLPLAHFVEHLPCQS